MRRLLPLALLATSTSAFSQTTAPVDPLDALDAPAPLVEGTTDSGLEPAGDPPPIAGLQGPDEEARAPRDLVRLVYSPGAFADRCPAVDDVKARVRTHLGYDPFGEPAQKVVVLFLDGPVDGAPARARLELLDTALRPLGSRVIDAADGCSELVATAALQISIALDPLAASSVPAATPDPAPHTPTPTAPTPAVVTGPVVVENAFDDVRIILAADIHVAMLLAPGDTMLGVGLGVGARWNYLSMRGELRGDFAGDDDDRTTAFPVLVSAVPCAHLPFLDLGDGDRLEVTGCLTGTTGVVPLIGEFSGVGFYVGGGGRAGLDWRFADETVVRVFSQIEGAVVRPSFTSSSGGSFTSSPVNIVLGLGFELGDW